MAKTAKRKPKGQPQQRAQTVATPKPSETQPEVPAKPIKRVHPLVVAFVVYHLIAITIYALPKPSDAVLNGTAQPRGSDAFLKFNQTVLKESAPIYAYDYVFGTWQYWDMFAPDPAQTDFWCDAEVQYLDGTKATFTYPHIHELSLPQKFVYERHRKYFERVNQAKFQFLLPSFGQYIAYQMAHDPLNPPVKVSISRHFQEWSGHHLIKEDKEPPYGAFKFYDYIVDLTKLYSDKGWKLGIH